MQPYLHNAPSCSIIYCYSDCFTHARYIQVLADASSKLFTIPSLEDASIKMRPYHYASYLPSAIAESILKTHPLDTFNYCLIPVGLLIMIGALYSLVESRCGSWIGLIGGASVLLIPDGFYQGMDNKFYSFLFMIIICPGLTYGIACSALAWLFVLRGVKFGNWRCILAGWAFALALAVYKAQLFIAISAPIFLFPLCFYPRIVLPVRIGLVLATLVQAIILMTLLRKVSVVPTLVLDGSGIDYMINNFIFSLDSNYVKNICKYLGSNYGEWGGKYIQMAIFETVAELGPIGIIILALSFCFRWHWIDRWFSVFTIITYFIMSLGLALNANGYAAEELIHRPFVWFYIIVVCWGISGVLASLRLKKSFFRKFGTKAWISIFLMSYLFFPCMAGYRLQALPSWKKDYFVIPDNLMTCCHYLRDKTNKNALILDSVGDGRLVVSCLAERQDYDTLIPERITPTDQEKALSALFDHKFGILPSDSFTPNAQNIMALKKILARNRYGLAPEVAQFMSKHHVDYLILEPNIALLGKSSDIEVIMGNPEECGDFRLIHCIEPSR